MRKFKIGVFGTGIDELCTKELMKSAWQIGGDIADHGGVLITGACRGYPYGAAIAVLEKGGMVLAFSPAMNEVEHLQKYRFPASPGENYIIIYTGLEKKGRNLVSTRTCDAAIFMAGRDGTMSEYYNFKDEAHTGKVIGIFKGSGGAADEIARLMRVLKKPTKATIVQDSNPERLLKRILIELKRKKI